MPTHYECALMCQKSTRTNVSQVLPRWEILNSTSALDDSEEKEHICYYLVPLTCYINKNTKEICIAFHESKLISDISVLKNKHESKLNWHGQKFYWQERLEKSLEIFFKGWPELLKTASIIVNSFNSQIKLLTINEILENISISNKSSETKKLINQICAGFAKLKDMPLVDLSREADKILNDLNNWGILKNPPVLYQTTYTGYSTGAAAAELFACRDGIKAVTFESPGCKHLIDADYRFQNYQKENIICYFLAPNKLNTLHPHIGELYRLYVSHILGNQHIFTNALCSAAASIERTSQKLCVIFTLYNLLFYNVEPKPLIGDFRFMVFLFLLSVVILGYKSATVEKRPSLDNYNWFLNQHSLESILSCFDQESGLPQRKSLMETWPSIEDLEKIPKGPFEQKEPFKFFRDYRKGIATIFRLNEVIEEKIKMINNYKVLKDITINPKNNDFFNSLR